VLRLTGDRSLVGQRRNRKRSETREGKAAKVRLQVLFGDRRKGVFYGILMEFV